MITIKQIIAVEPYKIFCKFSNEEILWVDVSGFVEKYKNNNSSIYQKLADKAYFKTVTLDSYGTLSWNNEIDFCPDVLYSKAKGKSI